MMDEAPGNILETVVLRLQIGVLGFTGQPGQAKDTLLYCALFSYYKMDFFICFMH
jgi:hypothetical protein